MTAGANDAVGGVSVGVGPIAVDGELGVGQVLPAAAGLSLTHLTDRRVQLSFAARSRHSSAASSTRRACTSAAVFCDGREGSALSGRGARRPERRTAVEQAAIY
jgi:hypothetical protein